MFAYLSQDPCNMSQDDRIFLCCVFLIQNTAEKFPNILQVSAQMIIGENQRIRGFLKKRETLLFRKSEKVCFPGRQEQIFPVDDVEFSLRIRDQVAAVKIRMAQDKGQIPVL